LITAPWPREHPPDLTTSGASLLRFARRRPAGSRAYGVFRLLPGLRGIRAGRTGAASETRRAGGFRTAVDFRSLPPVEFRTGQQPVRLAGDRRLVTSDGSSRHHRGDLSDHADSPRGDRPSRRHRVGADPRHVPLGVGTGEALNEHVLGDRWPPIGVRLEMLEEAVAIIRALHTGEQTTHRGKYYTVEEAQLYTTPDQPVPVYVSGFGPQATRLAARLGDGYCTVTPNKELIDLFRAEGGGDKPVQAGMKVCYGPDAEAAAKTAHRLWGNQLVPGQLGQILPNPSDFEQATTQVTVDAVAGAMACGPDKQRYFDTVRSYLDAGVDELYIQQIGPDQEQFFEFWTEQLAGEF